MSVSSLKIIVFAGPSLNSKEGMKILKADYRPPIKRGDVLEALKESPDIIAIIDGVFHQQPAVSHREIIEALNAGIMVVGGSSMGALRASELNDLGMIGIGYVYSQYKSGKIESDDDVAVVFSPENWEQLSDSLVSIDYNLKIACKKKIISKKHRDKILSTAKSIYYPHRTYKKIFKESKIESDVIRELSNFLDSHPCDIKQKDALEVLKYIKSL
ncbi:TfuA-related McrA-glycine thioamidation protein [Methanobacterium movens]